MSEVERLRAALAKAEAERERFKSMSVQEHLEHDQTKAENARLRDVVRELTDRGRVRPGSDWHENMGDVLWTDVPIEEPPYCGTPLDQDFPWQSTPVAKLFFVQLPPVFAGEFKAAEAELAEAREQKDGAYAERDCLVAALSKVFTAWLGRHPDDDESWDDDWRWIVFIDLPTGQASWHIHDSERLWFDHLEVHEGEHWDGHTTEQKYERLAEMRNGCAVPQAEVERLRDVVRECRNALARIANGRHPAQGECPVTASALRAAEAALGEDHETETKETEL